MPLVIVESPNKCPKLKKILGSNYVVMASVGHIMDLDKKNMGINTETWEPSYKINSDKRDVVAKLKKEAANHDEIFIATDADNEGHCIAFNIKDILPKKGKKIHRAIFKSITKQEVLHGIKNPVPFDEKAFAAQQARRMTDRMVGFKVSPVMWAKGLRNTSAGRVQSATLKWLVDREKEIRSFVKEEYWTIKSDLSNGFIVDFYGINNKKFVPKNKESVDGILSDMAESLEVSKYDAKSRKRAPYPPFDTASLQQECNSRFNWTSKRTMDIAQSLFSQGLTTYHRSDSVRVEPIKIKEIRDDIEKKFGKQYLSPKPRIYKNGDSAQDAHEAIRPTFEPTPSTLSVDERRLLELIRNRFMASQMADAVYDQTLISLENKGSKTYNFKARGSVLKFDGFLKVYGGASKDAILPSMKVGDKFKIAKNIPEQHFTKAPPRYTDASFVSKMKKEGVGRPSSYASISETLIRHKYIVRDGKTLKPTEIGIMVSDYLSEFFKDLTNDAFTAKLEAELDKIAQGGLDKESLMTDFYKSLMKDLEDAKRGSAGVIFKTNKDCPSCNDGSKMVRKVGKNGVFLGCENYPTCGQVMNFDDEGNVVENKVETGLPCPICNSKIVKKKSKFGSEFYGCSSYPTCNWIGDVDENGNVISKKKAPSEKLNQKCPNCSDGELVKRKGPYSDFAGCSNYPKCKTSFNIDENGNIVKKNSKKKTSAAKATGKKCSKCKTGELLERTGKFGIFYGCNRFPKCKNIEKELK